MMKNMIDELQQFGCIWAREGYLSYIPTPHWVGYSADASGKAVINAVVIEGEHSEDNLLSLMDLAASYHPRYAAIARDNWHWYDGKFFRETQAPTTKSEKPVFSDEASINMVFLILFQQLSNIGLSPQEIKKALDISLLINASHHDWDTIQNTQAFLQACREVQYTFNFFNIHLPKALSNDIIQTISSHLKVLPRQSKTLGKCYLSLTTARIQEDLHLDTVPQVEQEKLFKEVIEEFHITGNVLDPSCGDGDFLIHLAQYDAFESIVGNETNLHLFSILKVHQAITGNINAHFQLEPLQFLHNHYSFIVTQFPTMDGKTDQTSLQNYYPLLKQEGYLLLLYKGNISPIQPDQGPLQFVKQWVLSDWKAILLQKK